MKNARLTIILGVVACGAVALLALFAGSLASRQAAEPQAQVVGSPAPDRFTLVHLDYSDTALEPLLQAEVQKAQAQGLHPYVEFYADWCPACQAIRYSLGDEQDAQMVKAFSGTYVIQMDLDAWRDRLPENGLAVHEIPIFFELDAAAKPTGRTISGAAWGDNIPENMAPPLDAFFHPET